MGVRGEQRAGGQALEFAARTPRSRHTPLTCQLLQFRRASPAARGWPAAGWPRPGPAHSRTRPPRCRPQTSNTPKPPFCSPLLRTAIPGNSSETPVLCKPCNLPSVPSQALPRPSPPGWAPSSLRAQSAGRGHGEGGILRNKHGYLPRTRTSGPRPSPLTNAATLSPDGTQAPQTSCTHGRHSGSRARVRDHTRRGRDAPCPRSGHAPHVGQSSRPDSHLPPCSRPGRRKAADAQ